MMSVSRVVETATEAHFGLSLILTLINNHLTCKVSVGWNYLSIPKLQQCDRWSLVMNKQFHPTLYDGRDYLSMQGLELNNVSIRGPIWYLV